MLYRVRFYKKDDRGRERQLAAATPSVTSLASALRWAVASLEKTEREDPILAGQISGIRVSPWVEEPSATSVPAAPSLALAGTE